MYINYMLKLNILWSTWNYGTFCVLGRYSLGRGTQILKYGSSREIWDSWQP